MSLEVTIPLLILVGIMSAIIASIIGLGGGLTSVPLILIVIGDHNLEAKLISYCSIFALSMLAVYKYWRQKRVPDWKSAGLILIGVLPVTFVAEMFLAPMLASDELKNYFHFLYAFVAISVVLLINFKDKIKVKKFSNWMLPPLGMIVGLLSGTIGLSGGVLFMPILVVGLKKDMKEAAVTSLVLKIGAAAVNISAGLIDHQFQDFEHYSSPDHEYVVYQWLPLLIIPGSLIGAFIGPMFQKKVTDKQMRILFNCVMACVITWELVQGILLVTGVM